MNNYAVIFDMDGVLVDTAPYHLQAWQAFGEKHRHPVSREFFYQTFGMKNDQIFEKLFGNPLPPADSKRLGGEKEQIFRDCIHGHVRPYPGVMELFSDLERTRTTTVVGSSAPRENVEMAVRELGLDAYIRGYTCGDDVEQGKPAPDIFLKSAAIAGTEPKNCLVIEDTAVGVRAAKTAGMTALAVTNTCTREELKEADKVVETLEEVNAELAIKLIPSLVLNRSYIPIRRPA